MQCMVSFRVSSSSVAEAKTSVFSCAAPMPTMRRMCSPMPVSSGDCSGTDHRYSARCSPSQSTFSNFATSRMPCWVFRQSPGAKSVASAESPSSPPDASASPEPASSPSPEPALSDWDAPASAEPEARSSSPAPPQAVSTSSAAAPRAAAAESRRPDRAVRSETAAWTGCAARAAPVTVAAPRAPRSAASCADPPAVGTAM